MVILHRVRVAAADKNAELFQSALDGFPIVLGLVGAGFVAVSNSLRSRTTMDSKRLRRDYRRDPRTFTATAIASPEYAWAFADAVEGEEAKLDQLLEAYKHAREDAVRSCDSWGTFLVLLAASLAFLAWAVGVA